MGQLATSLYREVPICPQPIGQANVACGPKSASRQLKYYDKAVP